MKIIQLTEENFEKEVLERKDKILVDFFANWCGPCQMLAPTLEQIAETTDALIGKVNVDEASDLSLKYNISSIPCLILFQDGKELKRNVGLLNEDEVLEFINND